MHFHKLLGGLVPLVSLATCAPTDATAAVSHNQCAHARWTRGFDVHTDWEERWPITGKTHIYNFEITEVDEFVGPDGVAKHNAMLINGGYPGPEIKVNWGDRIDVTVTNKLEFNGTSIHWHGFHQVNSNTMDGVSGVTECPIPPGGSKKYSFIATQYGTSWYHSHISSQYTNGIVGTIQVDGPSSYPYDTDLGTFPISDWYYDTADHIVTRMMDPTNPFRPGVPGSPPPSDNLLFNGKNINPLGPGGEYAKVKLAAGKRHRLRLINTSADNTFSISIVGHTMTVISADFVPVVPYPTDQIYIAVGQRYDVIIEANQPAGAYWMNATFAASGLCGTSCNPHPAAIVTYEGTDENALPTNPGTPPVDTYCSDDLPLQPVIDRSAPATTFTGTPKDTLSVSLEVRDDISKVFWEVNGKPVDVLWEKPTLQYVVEGNLTFPDNANIIELPEDNEWSFWVIQNVSPIPHPMHLHGHDFLILGRSDALPDPANATSPILFNPATDAALLKYERPLRRDTTMLPGFGWLVIAFRSNANPGAWNFHCHIPWHMSQGLSVKFLERPDKIASVMDLDYIRPNCESWKTYAPTDRYAKLDSGLRV
ncbi:Cupredoxin [Bombardia bombarda]|uniref:laccase n=1 Tax=Bombardia bombarda TaxID=252184 RepID=A0AA39WHM2_9PEZI|nr:Cupredoxin [Bombardia bombarda]